MVPIANTKPQKRSSILIAGIPLPLHGLRRRRGRAVSVVREKTRPPPRTERHNHCTMLSGARAKRHPAISPVVKIAGFYGQTEARGSSVLPPGGSARQPGVEKRID